MRHPSEYSTVPLGAMRVMQVDPGTRITDERTGEFIVDDETCVAKGRVIFCTERTYSALARRAALQEGGGG